MWKEEKSSDKKMSDFKVEIDMELYVHNTEEELATFEGSSMVSW